MKQVEYNERKMDKKVELNQKLNNLKDILTENIEKLLQKEDKVALLVNRSQNNIPNAVLKLLFRLAETEAAGSG